MDNQPQPPTQVPQQVPPQAPPQAPQQPVQPPVVDKPKSDAKMILIIVAIALLLLVAGLIFMRNNKPKTTSSTPPTNTSQAQSTAEVQITKDGFMPETIKVKPGTAVNWTNDDTAQHRVVSDPHPTHGTLPELDSKDPLNAHETFVFTFDKAGTYTYHDELNPTTIKGTVIVE